AGTAPAPGAPAAAGASAAAWVGRITAERRGAVGRGIAEGRRAVRCRLTVDGGAAGVVRRATRVRTAVEGRVTEIDGIADVDIQDLEDDDRTEGGDMATSGREAAAAAADPSSAAFLAAAGAAMGAVDTPERIPGMTGREAGGRADTRIVPLGVP